MSKSCEKREENIGNAIPVYIIRNNALTMAYHWALYYAGYIFELQRNSNNETYLYPVDFSDKGPSYSIYRVGELADVTLEDFHSACDIYFTNNPNYTILANDCHCFCGEVYLFLHDELDYKATLQIRSAAVSSFEKLKKDAQSNHCLQAVTKYQQVFGENDYNDFYENSYKTWKANQDEVKKKRAELKG